MNIRVEPVSYGLCWFVSLGFFLCYQATGHHAIWVFLSGVTVGWAILLSIIMCVDESARWWRE